MPVYTIYTIFKVRTQLLILKFVTLSNNNFYKNKVLLYYYVLFYMYVNLITIINLKGREEHG